MSIRVTYVQSLTHSYLKISGELTDQSRDAVEFRVVRTFPFPRIHLSRFEPENVFLKPQRVKKT